MREKIKKFSKSRRIIFVYIEGIKRFNESRFKSGKVKRKATSSENKKFVVFVVKRALGIVKYMLIKKILIKNKILVNIFLTMPNALFTTKTTNFYSRSSFCFILTISPEECQMKILERKIFYFTLSSNFVPPNVYFNKKLEFFVIMIF